MNNTRSPAPWISIGAVGMVVLAGIGATVWVVASGKPAAAVPGGEGGTAGVATADDLRRAEVERKLVGTWSYSEQGIVTLLGFDKGGVVATHVYVVNQGTGFIDLNDKKDMSYEVTVKDDVATVVLKQKSRDEYRLESINDKGFDWSFDDPRFASRRTAHWSKVSDNPRQFWDDTKKKK